MKVRIPGGVFLAAVVIASAGWLAHYSTGEIARDADKVMQDEVARGAFSGVALISRGGSVLFERAYGLADAEWNVPNTTSTKFRIGSITKSFTAVLVMQLEQQGLLKLENSVCAYLEECPPGWDAITLHHLLSHTSGIYNFTQDEEVFTSLRAVPQTHEQVLARFLHKPLEFEAGSKGEYSNSNYYLLGLVIEKAAVAPYETVLRRQILDPLGMRDTGVTRRETLLDGRARGYRRNARGVFENDPDMHETWAFSAGALYSTAEDLAKFSEALGTDRLLPREARERMWRVVKEGYGYGWQSSMVAELTSDRRVVEHGGRVPGFGARLRRFVDEDVTIVVLANRLDADPSRAAMGLSAIAFGEPYESVFDRAAIRLSPAALRRYVGDYDLDGRTLTVFERDGNLFARYEGAPDVALLAESETVLFIPGVKGSVEAIQNRRGEITGLSATLGGTIIVVRKVR
jgi:CubicO group peptidase (beta-lactamase class C family)